MKPPAGSKVYKNKILASLPEADAGRLAPHLTPRIFRRGQTLHNAGAHVDTVYFMEDGVCSTVVTMSNGSSIEVAITGRDGFIGLPAVLGTGQSLGRSFIQIPGSGYAIDAEALAEQSRDVSGSLRLALQRGVQGLLTQASQTAACNRVHNLDDRLARWLLMCHDRMQSDELQITHEFLSVMLGTNRSSVTVAAGILQKAGMIEYSRGRVTIRNRKALENSACECYSIVQREFVRLGLL